MPKFEVGKGILKEFLKDFLYRFIFRWGQLDAPKLSIMYQWPPNICWELLEGSKTLSKYSSASQDHVLEVWTHLKNCCAEQLLPFFTVRNSLRISLPISNFGKKWPIFCKFLDGFNSYAKTFQEVQRDCQCGPLTPNIILLKFEYFSKNLFLMIFFWKIRFPRDRILHWTWEENHLKILFQSVTILKIVI